MTSLPAASQVPDRTRAQRSAALWSDRIWPVLAGVLTAVGVLGAAHVYTVLGTGLVFVGLWLLAALVVFGTFSENGVTGAQALRYGLMAGHALVVVIGLLVLFPIAGWFAAALAALTSPVVTRRLGRLRPRRPAAAAFPAPAGRRDQAMVDRKFSEIVSGLETDSPWGSEDA